MIVGLPRRRLFIPGRAPLILPGQRRYYVPGSRVFLSAGAASFPVGAANFDGTNDYMTLASSFAGITDGKAGTLSFFLREQADSTSQDVFSFQTATLNGIFVRRNNTDNKWLIDGYDPTPTFKMERVAATANLVADGWVHHYFTWDLAQSLCRYFRNGAADEGAVTTNNVALDYTTGQVRIGAHGDTAGNKLNADIAELYFNTTYIAPTAGNLLLFRKADGRPEDLGSTGSAPTGSAPSAYYRVAAGAAASTFATDVSGNGNNMTVTGALTSSTTSPSD